ncbi:sugar ABC transporter substrate-binding protein [Bombiscardovia nodaiensis]|uniref:Sugar ABC transporter substrate-binding protein n=1 Tax=Bombiscardovia nodaiensis TaxID=2932181 RepID=A0ABM8B8N2_9BIFI|nr:sugar ABC transporter substrate-binding protein [Bombiscardovia nodaiensis]
MRKSVQLALSVVCTAAAVVSLTGCGGGSSSSGDSKELKFQTWNLKNDKYTSYFEDLIKQFEKENTGVHIKWVDQPADNYEDKLSTDAAAGELPDVIDMGPEAAYTLASAGALLDIAKEDPKAKDQYLDAAWQSATFKGPHMEDGTYGLPWYLNTGPTLYNKQLLDECGLDSNNVPKTQDEMFDNAKTFGQKCGGKYAMTTGLPSIQDFGMYGVQLMNKDHTKFTFNSEKGIEFVQHYVDMYKAQAFTDDMLNSTSSGESKSFNSGSQAFLNASLYSIDDMKQNAPKIFEHMGITNMVANTHPNMMMEMMTVSAKTKNKDMAIKLAKFVTDSKNQLTFDKKANVFPSSKGTIDDAFFNPTGDDMNAEGMRMVAKQVRDGRIWGPPQFTSVDAKRLNEQIALALQGKKTPKEALDDVVNFANDRLK